MSDLKHGSNEIAYRAFGAEWKGSDSHSGLQGSLLSCDKHHNITWKLNMAMQLVIFSVCCGSRSLLLHGMFINNVNELDKKYQ